MIGLTTPLDPLHNDGYQFFSGIGLAVFFPITYYWHHRCHRVRCWRWGHADPEHGQPTCRKHSPHFTRGVANRDLSFAEAADAKALARLDVEVRAGFITEAQRGCS